MAPERPERQENQSDKRGNHGEPTDVVNPFAPLESSYRRESDGRDDGADDDERDEMIFREPCGPGADQVREFGWERRRESPRLPRNRKTRDSMR